MDDKILLAELQMLLNNVPAFETFDRQSIDEHQWVAKVDVLLHRYNPFEGDRFRFFSSVLDSETETRDEALTGIMSILHRAVADLELRIPQGDSQVYGPGAVYDFYRAIKELLATAQNSTLMIDPYFDESVLDTYLPGLPKSVKVKILLSKYAGQVKIAAEKYIAQHQIQLEVRSSKELHDRVIFIDDNSCWVVGQSLKNAAKKKPTYIAPLAPDMAKLKKDQYEEIWKRATIV